MNELEKHYNAVCDEYLMRFCANYDLDGETSWVADEYGGISIVGDYYFNFEVVKYAVDNELTDTDELISWYDYTIDGYTYKFHCPNFKSWHEGCPRLSVEQINHIKELQARVDEAKKLLNDYLEELGNEN